MSLTKGQLLIFQSFFGVLKNTQLKIVMLILGVLYSAIPHSHNKIELTVLLKQQKSISSQSWRLEVQDLGATMVRLY